METLEAYLCWNFWMDLLLCTAAALGCGKDRFAPCVPAALLGTVCAAAARQGLLPGTWFAPLAAGAGMACAAVRPSDVKTALRANALLWSGAVFAAGSQILALQCAPLPAAGLLAASAAGVGLNLYLVRMRRMRIHSWDVQLILRTGAGVVRFRALVDTGNHLHEPISGLPVMIVEENSVRHALPEEFDPKGASLPPGWRMVSYGVLGSAGKMPCFRPDRLLVRCDGRWLLAPDIWVAVYPGRIPGQTQALAPAVLGAIRPAEGGAMRSAGRRERA